MGCASDSWHITGWELLVQEDQVSRILEEGLWSANRRLAALVPRDGLWLI